MHLKFGKCVLYITDYRLTERKNPFPCTKLSMWTVGAKIDVLGLLVHGNVVVEFFRKVFLANCLLWKTLKWRKYAKQNPLKRDHAYETQIVAIQGNITATRYRNDVIRSVLLRHISANLCMMLSSHAVSCQAPRSTLVMFVANNMQKLRRNAKIWI